MSNAYAHISVLRDEVINLLNIHPEGIYIDATLGGGGHAKAILNKLDKQKGNLIVVDQDIVALENSVPHEACITPIYANFKYLRHFLKYYGIHKVNGILADLGVSSHHFDTADRGFSIMHDGPLDMRMNPNQILNAQYVLEEYSTEKLKFIFQHYGEISNTNTLVKLIVDSRKKMKFTSTRILANLVATIARGANKMQYLAKVFQAIRIEVNNELENLKTFIADCANFLTPQGRLAIISFHSLEDRIIKQAFRDKRDNDGQNVWEILYKKPLMANQEEISINKRARSARLRVGSKI